MSDVPIVVPSKGRAGRVMAFNAVRPIVLTVAEEEMADYRAAYPDAQIVPHPDKVRGYSPIRQWIYETFGDHFVLVDDVKHMIQSVEPEQPARIRDLDHAYEVIQATGRVARQMGVYLWGIANSGDGRNYNPLRPFRTTGFLIGGWCGMFAGSDLWFPDDPYCTVEDYWVSALNAYHHRRIWADTRYGFVTHRTFRETGGMAEFRDLEREKEWNERLRAAFGREAFPPRGEGQWAGTIPSKHEYQRALKVPW